MKRSELERFLGEKVKIILFDNHEFEGELHKTWEPELENKPSLYYPTNYYFLFDREKDRSSSWLFKVTHVKKIRLAKSN